MRFNILTLIAAVGLLTVGCKNAAPITHAAFTAAVTLGEQYALEKHPEATPYVRASVPVVCAVANSTNFSSDAVVTALKAANVTNTVTVDILNSSLALLNVVIANLSTNQTEVRAYGQDLCNGLQAGLPPTGVMAKHRQLPPHL